MIKIIKDISSIIYILNALCLLFNVIIFDNVFIGYINLIILFSGVIIYALIDSIRYEEEFEEEEYKKIKRIKKGKTNEFNTNIFKKQL